MSALLAWEVENGDGLHGIYDWRKAMLEIGEVTR